MHVLIIGAAGMIGAKLAKALVDRGTLGGREMQRLTLADIVAPVPPAGAGMPVNTLVADLADTAVAASLVDLRADVIFHLAAVVSAGAEQDFEAGYRTNLDGTRALFEAIRLADDYCPRLVFTSSLAVYGAPLPDPVPDDHIRAPQTSYGVQKAITELLLDDYTRRGFFDGVGIRLPTIVIRPGAPNAAASGFFSGILREPLAGQRAVLPVDDTVRHWLASPRSAVGFLIHAATLDGAAIGPRRTLNMPGVAATVADQLAALERAAGPGALDLIDRTPDPAIAGIITAWPRSFAPDRALALGFRAETTVDELIAVYRADDAPGMAQ
ncbi:D-erythronate dehydrogenase [Yoonia sp.]|uniref:D-erythronate dehydrogenase n=1 Tax=Yoonia sp. TaxID=2212373 RepID=UPI003F6D199D